MSVNVEQVTKPRKSSNDDLPKKTKDNSAEIPISDSTTTNNNSQCVSTTGNCLSEKYRAEGLFKGRLPSTKWRQQKLQLFEQQVENLKNNDQNIPSNGNEENEWDWLRIVMDVDGHDVVAGLQYVRKDSTEDPPMGIEPFSRPYHERRLSLAGSEEVL